MQLKRTDCPPPKHCTFSNLFAETVAVVSKDTGPVSPAPREEAPLTVHVGVQGSLLSAGFPERGAGDRDVGAVC